CFAARRAAASRSPGGGYRVRNQSTDDRISCRSLSLMGARTYASNSSGVSRRSARSRMRRNASGDGGGIRGGLMCAPEDVTLQAYEYPRRPLVARQIVL